MDVPNFSVAFNAADIASVISKVGEHTGQLLKDQEARIQHKARRAERLRKNDAAGARVTYADQAVLANLDWGIDAVEEAIWTSNPDAKSARLEYAEKLLQVCASLDCRSSLVTAGVANSFLSAWARFNLALVWKLRNNELRAVNEILEMFLVEPYFSRVDFAPGLWESIFLPHVTSIVEWYAEQRQSLSTSHSTDEFEDESPAATKHSPQSQELEKLYHDSLDENTRQYARFYCECLNHDSASKRGIPLMPIAETPMTPAKFHPDKERLSAAVNAPSALTSNSFSGELDDGALPQGESHDFEDRPFRSGNAAARADGNDAQTNGIPRPASQSKKVITRSTTQRRKFQNAQRAGAGEDMSGPLVKSDVQELPSEPDQVKTVSRELQRSASLNHRVLVQRVLNRSVSSSSARFSAASTQAQLTNEESSLSDAELDHEREFSEDQRREAAAVSTTRRIERNLSRASSTFSLDGDESVKDAEYFEDEQDENGTSISNGLFAPSVNSPVEIRSSYVEEDQLKTHGKAAKYIKNQSPPLVVRAPKDFACPITSQLFTDPVTLETGQTYERKAIQEWLDNGNTTCPITRQTLQLNGLPKTDHVMKRLVESWKDQFSQTTQEFHPAQSLSTAFSFQLEVRTPHKSAIGRSISITSERSPEPTSPQLDVRTPHKSALTRSISLTRDRSPEPTSPRSVSSSSSSTDTFVSRKSTSRLTTSLLIKEQDRTGNLYTVLEDLRSTLDFLCSSEDLYSCESAVLWSARLWKDSGADPEVATMLSRHEVMNSLIAVLASSGSLEVLRATLYLISGIVTALERTRDMIVEVDPEVQCLMETLKKGISTAAVVLYQLKLPTSQLIALDLLVLLVDILKESEETKDATDRYFPVSIRPKTAAILIMDQIVTCSDQATIKRNSRTIIELGAMPSLTASLESDSIDERIGAVSLLLHCMQSDGRCRGIVARSAHLGPVVQLLHSGNNQTVTSTISFLSELIRVTRRVQIYDILEVIRSEGLLSSMHVLLIQLQIAPLQQRPVAAGLLLQLDLMSEPLKRSMYRDEVIDTFVEALTNGSSSTQIEAANVLLGLGSRFSPSGKSLMEACLLKLAGLDKYYVSLMNEDPLFAVQMEEVEDTALLWEKRVAGALLEDEGSIVRAIAKGIESRTQEVFRPCFTTATWLTCLSPSLPDAGVMNKVRIYFLQPFVKVLETSKDTKVKVLATLALHSLFSQPEGAKELADCGDRVRDKLRPLKKLTWAARDLLENHLHSSSTTSDEVGSYMEDGEIDVSENGEVRAFIQWNRNLYSGHSDGSLKVWNIERKFPLLIQEVREHTKSVTCLAAAPSMDRLYSGSLDKTIRFWTLGQDTIKCLHIFELKDSVQGLAVMGPMACIIPQGPGFQVQYEEAATKFLNSNKHVQSLTISEGKVICGCTDNSIQEFDPIEDSMVVLQNGVRTLLGKKPIYAIQVYKDFIYAAGSPVDGIACKVWSRSSLSLVGHIVTSAEVRSMAINANFIFLGSTSGSVEVWKQGKFQIATKMAVGSKVNCLHADGDVLYSGSEDGKIRVWTCVYIIMLAVFLVWEMTITASGFIATPRFAG